jgi:hypothetical protein
MNTKYETYRKRNEEMKGLNRFLDIFAAVTAMIIFVAVTWFYLVAL